MLATRSSIPYMDFTDSAPANDGISTVREDDRYREHTRDGVCERSHRASGLSLINVEPRQHVRYNELASIWRYARVRSIVIVSAQYHSNHSETTYTRPFRGIVRIRVQSLV